jgi:hypothetical protein
MKKIPYAKLLLHGWLMRLALLHKGMFYEIHITYGDLKALSLRLRIAFNEWRLWRCESRIAAAKDVEAEEMNERKKR